LTNIPTNALYGVMGTQKRRPGTETSCGELVHWSLRLILKAGLVKPTLKDYVMVPDKHGPSWVRAKDLLSYYRSAVGEVKTDFPDYLTLQEERISDEELWL
jgi:hypothetical protein